ncbi:hypothetical protein GW17_00051031 [Ensete ventricosum]|nr:hypothetical protein GW17_00051031 [Ensete ventricosum]
MAGACRGAAYGRRKCPRPGRKGQPCGPTGGRWQEWSPAHEVSPEGSSAYRKGGCPCRRRASPSLAKSSGGGDGSQRGVRASFREKDDPAPMNSENSEDYPRGMEMRRCTHRSYYE